jgi:hypothetical protein
MDLSIFLQISPYLKHFAQTGIERYYPGIKSVELCYEHGSQKIFGCGIDAKKEIALLKASSEVIERLLCFTLFKAGEYRTSGSNGFSWNRNRQDAMIHAESELIERDAFMWHFLNEQKFKSLKIPDNLRPCISLPGTLGLSKMNTPDKYQAYIAWFRYEKGGLLLGAAAGLSLLSPERIIFKSLTEVLLNVRVVEYLKSRSLSLEQFSKLKNPSVTDHILLGLDNEYSKWFYETFLSQEGEFVLREEPKVEFTFFDDNHMLDSSFRSGLVKAHSKFCQEIFWPHFSEDLINQNIFPKRGKINKLPHPFP